MFGSLDAGYSFVQTEAVLDGQSSKPSYYGTIVTPAVGASYRMGDKMRLNLSLGYTIQNVSYQGVGFNLGGLGLKLGFAF